MQLDAPPKATESPALFRADRQSVTFAAQKDGKVRVTCASWDDHKVVLEGEAFEVRWGPQGVEGRVVTRVVPPLVEERDPFWVPDVPSIAPIASIGLTYGQTGGE